MRVGTPRAIIFDLFGVIYGRGGVDREIFELIEDLKPKFKIGLLSNTTQDQLDSLLSQEQQEIFDAIGVSGEMGFAKPDERAFLEISRRLEEFTSDCLMIDDSEVNCVGAQTAGMQAICFVNLSDLRRSLKNYGILTS